MRYSQRITIITIRKPAQKNINQELQWLGSSLGLFNLRDKDKSCFRVFIELVKTAKANYPLSSDELADRLGLSRGTVVHHLHKLLDAGIVVPTERGYILRVNNLQDLIDEVEKDTIRTITDLKKMAKEIDESLGL
ncbi:helix-turn-helix domain-containing protein [Candidatus Woesearchaeota archaeon]|nr:helix-turn-helix domain-containing protein [Candidatus Woesearchaeota archaeon]